MSLDAHEARLDALEKRMDEAEGKIDKHGDWISWATGIGVTIAAVLGLFSGWLKQKLGLGD